MLRRFEGTDVGYGYGALIEPPYRTVSKGHGRTVPVPYPYRIDRIAGMMTQTYEIVGQAGAVSKSYSIGGADPSGGFSSLNYNKKSFSSA